jgi:small subunit ribosomal protein S7
MPRRAEIQPRTIEPDAVHGSVLVAQLVNRLMLNGKKSVAERTVYDALALASEKTGKPQLEVRSRRVGGANYQVPIEVPQRRARTLAIRWIVQFARDRREKHMGDKLAGELMDAVNSQGGAYKKKDDIYRMAQANKAFAHYRW